ncbi:YL1 nuclear protein [Glomus cerebriforme]|uniref:YL1 nuclear protein n=1 Tax=Glomus cerebriforme TaxID=658196 RepID=A0A397SEV7_9GLOM|nr:YL1 nuclear protein [Glomus cerebriforme]
MSLVATRARRPNAGNRMKELLERELEIEEMFEEVANDDDFMAIQEEEDIIDSDFDQSTEDEEEDEEAAEKQLLAEEKIEKKKKAKKVTLTPLAPFLRTRSKSKSTEKPKAIPGKEVKNGSIKERKKKQPSQVPLLSGTRSSSRTHTVQSKQMLAEKLREYEARKALIPKKEKIPEKPKTQEELLAQAKITEEKNLASLHAYEIKEAEKKKTVTKLNKARIHGPFIRQISYVCGDDKRNKKRPRLITEVPADEDEIDITREIHDANDTNNTNDQDVSSDNLQYTRNTRNIIIFKDFDKKLEAELFQEWKKKPQEIERAICPITGEPAKYKDPKSGVPYANMEAYKRLQQILRHEYLWSSEKGTFVIKSSNNKKRNAFKAKKGPNRLIKFTALNETNVQPTEQPVDPLDAPLKQCETLYNLALRRDHASAKELYLKLLKHDLMKNPTFQIPNNGIPLSQRITRLKYCVLKNYAELLEHEHHIQRTKIDAQNAIEYYHRALRIDQSDHSIWLRIGKLAMSEEINDPQYARSALTKALEDFNVAQSFPSFDESDETRVPPVFLSPIHREALDELCRLLYDTGDFYACLRAIDKGLKVDPYNRTLNQLRIQLLENTWVRSLLPNDYYENSPPIIRPLYSEDIPRRLKPSGVFSPNAMKSLRFNLQNCTWNGLGELLLSIYDKIMSCKINVDDDSLVPVKSRHIIIELQSNVVKTPDMNEIISGPVQKRKRKEPPNDYNIDKTTPTRSSRVTSKMTSKIDSFNQKRDEALSEFLEKIESIIEKVEPDYLISIKQEDDVETDKFLLYFSKVWNQHVLSEYHGTNVEEAINNPRSNTASDPRFYMFTPHTDPPLSNSYFHENYRTQESFISFVNDMNNKNSGITDYLCMYIIQLFGKFVEVEGGIRPLWLCRWPDGLKEIVREILHRVDNQMLAMIENSCTDWDKSDNCANVIMEEISDNIFQQMKQKSEVLMGVCEFLFDSQISRNGGAPSDDAQDSSKHYQEMPSNLQVTLDMCKWLIYRSSWIVMDFVSHAESQGVHSEEDEQKWKYHHKMWENWSNQLNARYWWCTARIDFWQGDLDKAKVSFEECKRILELGECDDIVIVNCAFDAHINTTIINNKVGSLESRKDLPEDDWSRAITHFADTIKFLLNWVSDNIDEDRIVQFWTTIHSINEAISNVTLFVANGHSVANLPANEYKKFKKYFRILYKTSFEILFPKTEEIVNAEAELSEPLHILCVRTWILFYHLLKEKPSDLDEDDFSEFLVTIHDQLGERYICGTDNGAFLKFCIKTFTELHPSENRVYEYQCCHCLYRVVLSVDTEVPWDHKTQPVELDTKTAELLFKNIRNYINEKPFRTWQIKNDVKDTLDKIANIVIPPRDDRFDQCSWRTQHFLESEINFYEAIQYKEHDHYVSDLGAVSYRDAGEDITDLYYFRGKILQYQFKTRTKGNQTRAIETLEKAIEQFTYDLSINPLRFASWYALGACYASLADENLTWNAEEILNNKEKISTYQRKSFLCYARAAKVITWFSGQQSPTVPTDEVNFWRDFGYQVYSMITEPMSMMAFQLNPYHAVLWRKPSFEDAYAFAAFCFGKAMQHERYLIENQSDKENGTPIIHDWRIPYMLGKCYQKLQRNPEVVIQLYKLAINRTPEKSSVSGQEKILDAEYKMTSALSKYLMENKIKPYIVEKYLGIDVENDEVVHKEPQNEPGELGGFDIQKPEYRHAYDLICSKLEDIRKTDKNKWHHRPVYRHAWLIYNVEQKPEIAISILSPLFHLKLTSKTFMNVWKPEFERSGRHFIYVHEYISFFMDLARATLNIDILNKMSEKLRKASNIILKDKTIQMELANAYKYVDQMQKPTIDEEMNIQNNEEGEESDERDNAKEHEPPNNVMSVASLITQDNDSPMTIDFVEPANTSYSEI